MRLLLVGGTFNPIHVGHLMIAEEIAQEFAYDTVVFVPSFAPPHKSLSVDPGSEARLAMLILALSEYPRFKADDCEVRRKGVSYTMDTLDHIIASYPLEGKPGLVIGDDLASGFGSWRDPDGICKRADLIVARRSGEVFNIAYPHRLAGNMMLPISSTDIRNRIATGRPWGPLVPAPARAYIEDNALYRQGEL